MSIKCAWTGLRLVSSVNSVLCYIIFLSCSFFYLFKLCWLFDLEIFSIFLDDISWNSQNYKNPKHNGNVAFIIELWCCYFYRATKVWVNAHLYWVIFLLHHGNGNWGLPIQLELLLLTSLAEPGYPLSYNQSYLDFTTYTSLFIWLFISLFILFFKCTKYFSCIM